MARTNSITSPQAAPHGVEEPRFTEVTRSVLRANQREILRLVSGNSGLVIKSIDYADTKVILGRRYFDGLWEAIAGFRETLAITMDRQLFHAIIQSADTLEEELRVGNLHSIDEAFSDD